MMGAQERRWIVVMEQVVGGEGAARTVAGWSAVLVRQVWRITAR